MCQMFGIWHIYHTKHKNGDLSDVSKSQKLCNMTTIPSQILDGTNRNGINFYSFLFSFLSPLSSLFLFSSLSPIPSLFSLCWLLSLYSSLRTFDQSSDDDNALHRWGLGGQLLGNAQSRSGLFAEFTSSLSLTSVPLTNSSQSLLPSKAATADLAQLPSISLSHARSHSRADPTPRLLLISPSSLSSLSTFHSTSLWLLVMGFFFLQFGLIWYWWVIMVVGLQ